jgi:hypothetical protein
VSWDHWQRRCRAVRAKGYKLTPSVEFAQVGNDLKATKFLEELDNHPQIGPMIDCTSSFEIEQEEMMRKSVSRRHNLLDS